MKKILIIEDDFLIRENISELIEVYGYQIEIAEDGLKGLEVVKKFCPDLIICDVMMPKLNGYDVLKQLKSSPKTAKIPFIFLTAKSEKMSVFKGLDLGADDYLLKPFECSELLDIMKRLLN
ncbi:response regulator transcription factor [Ochrovirga pacifica]|uniref:response regulator transcription factor n=1 Tax=Ochrovirga pacifica TaxID=1042376 RepID=UPI001111972A|nr:response regulator [Ochrovirga pacifica]